MNYSGYQSPPFPCAFIWRRLHSLTGLWLVLFLIEHLLTNSQAALFMGEDGSGFVRAVNFLKNLPYLPVLEIFLLGLPFLIHGFFGVRYLFTGEYNSFPTDGSTPSLPQYSRNHAYTWQRLTSWILFFGVIAHVLHMRFVDYPTSAQLGTQHLYIVRLNGDPGLYTLSKRLGFDLYDSKQVGEIKESPLTEQTKSPGEEPPIQEGLEAQKRQQNRQWLKALEKWPLNESQLIAVSPSFGIAELLIVRDSFKSPLMIFLYSSFVLAACFHAFNGLWTFMISWGITLTARSQYWMRKLSTFLMILLSFLGLVAIWGSYWLNLKD